MIRKTLIYVVFLFVLSGCYYDSEDELYPSIAPNNCDSIIGLYSIEVKPLLDIKCNGCHNTQNPSAGIILDTYEKAKFTALNGKLFEAVRHESGVSPMPPGAPKLSDCDIAKIKKWKDLGAPNN